MQILMEYYVEEHKSKSILRSLPVYYLKSCIFQVNSETEMTCSIPLLMQPLEGGRIGAASLQLS